MDGRRSPIACCRLLFVTIRCEEREYLSTAHRIRELLNLLRIRLQILWQIDLKEPRAVGFLLEQTILLKDGIHGRDQLRYRRRVIPDRIGDREIRGKVSRVG